MIRITGKALFRKVLILRGGEDFLFDATLGLVSPFDVQQWLARRRDRA